MSAVTYAWPRWTLAGAVGSVAGPLLVSLMSTWVHYTFAPALAGVFIAETFAIRSWMFHVGNGALSALLGWTLTRDLRDQHHFFSNPTILVAAGIAAGFAYWLIAGWTAGFWKPVSARRSEVERPFA